MTDGPIQLQDFLHTLPDTAQTKVCRRKTALSKNRLLLAVWVKVPRVHKAPESSSDSSNIQTSKGSNRTPQIAVLVDVNLSPRGTG